MLARASLAIAAFAFAGAAAADTAYLEPSTFSPRLDQTITIETSFNDYCCVPKYAVRSQAFAVISPDGESRVPDRIELFSNSSIIEQKISESGTTRVTTGERLGRKGGEYVLVDGQYHMVNSEDAEPFDIPEGAPILSSQTATVSDTYVTVGEATWSSVHVPVGRLAMVPVQHPSGLATGDMFELIVTFDGAPLVGQALVLTRSGQKERAGDEGLEVRTDETGRIALELIHPGTHLIMTRMQALAPAGAETDIRSYTTSLTFTVTR